MLDRETLFSFTWDQLGNKVNLAAAVEHHLNKSSMFTQISELPSPSSFENLSANLETLHHAAAFRVKKIMILQNHWKEGT